jgi:hypothetical protein
VLVLLRKIAILGCWNEAVEAEAIPHKSKSTEPSHNFLISCCIRCS